jgi:hypothetical protein
MSDDKPAAGSEEPTVEQGSVPAASEQPHQQPAEHTVAQQPVASRQRFVERVWGLKAVIAVALASVIIGGLGGAALAKGGDRQGRDGRMGFGHGPGPGFGQGFGRGPNGQGPPGQMKRMPGQGQQGRGFGQNDDDSRS